MPTERPIISVVVTAKLLKKIDKFWHQNEFRSRSEAIVWMINYVLREKPEVPPKEERSLIYYRD